MSTVSSFVFEAGTTLNTRDPDLIGEYGAPTSIDGHMAMDVQCKQVARESGSASYPQQFSPAWDKQRLRLLVPSNDDSLQYE